MNRLGVPALIVFAARPVVAHSTDQPHSEASPVPPVVFLAGVLVLGTAVYLDYRDELGRTLANAGVGLGVLAMLAGLALLFL